MFDGIARPIKTFDRTGVATRITHDLIAPPTPPGPPACAATPACPGAPGLLVETRTEDSLGRVTSELHDGGKRKLGMVDANGNLSTRGVDANCNCVCERDANGVGEDREYDGANRLLKRTDTSCASVSMVLDAAGNEVLATDALGHTSFASYDGLDRKRSAADRLGGITSRVYDAAGNLLSRTDPEGKTTSYHYDARNLKEDETYADGGMRLFAHDAAGRPLWVLDQAGNSTGYVHDRADRLVERSYPVGGGDTFTYDAADRMIDADSSRYGTKVLRAWDAEGRLTAESLTLDGKTYAVAHGHDLAGRPTSLTYPDGQLLQRTFTDVDRIATLTLAASAADPAVAVAALTHDAGGRRLSSTLGNGLVEFRAYATDNRLLSVDVPGKAGFVYTHDANKNPTSQSSSVDPLDAQTYAFDPADRLTSFTRGDGPARSYALSPAGDWDDVVTGGASKPRTHNDLHELTVRDAQLLQYDLRGNLTDDGPASSYVWDFDNHLKSATVAGSAIEYRYDALGRRVQRTALGQTTTFVHDEWRTIAEYAGGADPSNPAKIFVFGEALDEVVMMMNALGQRYFYHANGLSSVQALTDAGGAVVEAYRYDPYGEPVVLTGPGPDGLWFTGDEPPRPRAPPGTPTLTGQRADGETGLFYYKKRYYSSELGRFLSRDPAHYDEEQAYVYAGNNPIAAFDPMGTEDTPACGKCCLFLGEPGSRNWKVNAYVESWVAPAEVTGVMLLTESSGPLGSISTTYVLASNTLLEENVAHSFSVTSTTRAGDPDKAELIFQTSLKDVPGSYVQDIAVEH